MTDSNYTAFALIMDRSGTMGAIREEAENAVNTFIDAQKNLPGKATLTFAQFDNQYELVFTNKPIVEVEKILLEPRGLTALCDAVGRTVVSFGESLAAMPEDQRPGKVLVAIVTDGLENASKEWTKPKIKNLIETQRNMWNWEFIYLGANVDAFAEGVAMGVAAASSKGWVANTAGARKMSSDLSSYAVSYRSTGKGKWSDDDTPQDTP